jgi:hypothetical protein
MEEERTSVFIPFSALQAKPATDCPCVERNGGKGYCGTRIAATLHLPPSSPGAGIPPMRKLKLDLDHLTVESFDTAPREKEKGTVIGEQCTCYTQCTCPGCPTCDNTCPATCAFTCDDPSCAESCAGSCAPDYSCWQTCGGQYTCESETGHQIICEC